MPHSYVTWLVHTWHASFICDMTHSCMTWLIHMWHDLFMCDMPHSYVTILIHVWHKSFIFDMTYSNVTCLIHTWHDSFIRDMPHLCVTWLILVWHDSFMWDMTHLSVTRTHSLVCHMTHPCIHCYFINHTHPCARKHQPPQKMAQNYNTFILFCSNWHICTPPCIHLLFFSADMGDTSLKETCTGHSYPKSAVLCVASRWGAFKWVAVCCSVV